jgi:hypothetical protein
MFYLLDLAIVAVSYNYKLNIFFFWNLDFIFQVRGARDMLFNCLALENEGFKVLNYEPGICYTDMTKEIVVLYPEEFKSLIIFLFYKTYLSIKTNFFLII